MDFAIKLFVLYMYGILKANINVNYTGTFVPIRKADDITFFPCSFIVK